MAGSSHAPPPGQKPGWPKPPRLLGMFFYVIGVTVLFGLLSTIATDAQARAVPYTEFKQVVRSGKVASVTISEECIRGTLMSQRQDLKLHGQPIAERRAQGREQRDNDGSHRGTLFAEAGKVNVFKKNQILGTLSAIALGDNVVARVAYK